MLLFQTKLLLKGNLFSGLKVMSFQHLQWGLNTFLLICEIMCKGIQVMLDSSKKYDASFYSDLRQCGSTC